MHADQPGTRLSRYLTGACIEDVNHEIYGGLYSQMLFGESFQEPAIMAGPPSAFSIRRSLVRRRRRPVSGAGAEGPKLVAFPAGPRIDRVGVEVFLADASAGNAGLIVRVNKPGAGPDNFDGYEVSLDAAKSIRSSWLARPQFGGRFAMLRMPCRLGNGFRSCRSRLSDNALEGFRRRQERPRQPRTQWPLAGRKWRRPARLGKREGSAIASCG